MSRSQQRPPDRQRSDPTDQLVEVVGTALVAGGECLVRRPGEPVVFVTGLLPGERAIVRVHQSHRDFAKASVVNLLDPSADRVVPPCPRVAEGCGGCDWQHLTPAAQHRHKRLIVVDALRRGAGLADAESRVSIGASLDAVAYRTTVRAAVDSEGRAGFRRLRGHRVVVSGACLVADPRIAEVLASGRFEGADEVVVRVSDADNSVVVTTRATGVNMQLPAGVRRTDDAHQLNESVGPVHLRVSAGSFFQSSARAAALLVAAVADALRDTSSTAPAGPAQRGVLADLYGGVGLFAAALGSSYRRVVVVELSALAVRDARTNLVAHPSAMVVEADVDTWRPAHLPAGHIDVVADPSRSGLGRAGVATITALGPERVVLVSCDAAALGRDTRLLAAEGWVLDHSTVLDLFPHTHHLEAVTRFVRADHGARTG